MTALVSGPFPVSRGPRTGRTTALPGRCAMPVMRPVAGRPPPTEVRRAPLHHPRAGLGRFGEPRARRAGRPGWVVPPPAADRERPTAAAAGGAPPPGDPPPPARPRPATRPPG